MKTATIRLTLLLLAFSILAGASGAADDLAKNFASPPPSARPWVFWFWINGNISKAGITADLEAMKRVGIGGVLWMEVSGPWWAPEGKVTALSPEWHDCMQWAFRECDRLGLQFDLSVDFGYGSGGPHITPELSMQKLYWSNLAYAGTSDLPISEFWASGTDVFPSPRPRTGGYEMSTKVMASAAHTYGRPVIGAESFTAGRGWRDHPFLLKAMGDQKY